MARGWESKSVESQIEAAEGRAQQSRHMQLSAEQVALARERELLELSRARVLHDIETVTHARYREMLERSLAFLDEKLAKLDELSRPDLHGSH
ncbi:MAG TPA: hypothetical protein VH477_02765 [Bryobacteraceae bacterium]|jgi:hypothetical protein